MTAATQIAKIGSISSLPELDGYEAEAKRRGITADELVAVHKKRAALSQNGRRKK